jgi:hypothetical protein
VIGWKNVTPPDVQLPLPPDRRPSRTPPSYSGEPLSPAALQMFVLIRPVTSSHAPSQGPSGTV